MADIVSRKSENDEQWKAQRQAERENALAMQDAGVTEITDNPEAYAQYLEMQGDNPTYSPGNIALVMLQNPDATLIGTKERWKTIGRSVADTEVGKGVKIFSRSTFGKGYTLVDAFDVKQTHGRDIKPVALQNDSKEMESALTTLLNYSVVPVVVDAELDGPALYDDVKMELAINPDYPDNEAFAAIATEVAHIRFHAKGVNTGYSREECELDAQSVSYILCKRFGVQRDLPDTAGLAVLYEGWTPQERRQALDSIQNMEKQIGGSIERSIAPPQRNRTAPNRTTR